MAGMQTPSPYETPQMQGMPQPPPVFDMPAAPEPGAIKVFGIMHLVVAAYGLFMILAGLLGTLFLGGMAKGLGATSMPGRPTNAGLEKAVSEYLTALGPYTYASLAFNVVLTVMLILAGIGLLKSRESGRVMSVRYAWASIAFKLAALVYTFSHVIPATKRLADTMYQGMPGSMSAVMGPVMQYSQVFGVLVTFLYPAVVLFVMKGNSVREYLAGREA